MDKVTVTELNRNTAAVLRQVTATKDIIVTEHGKPRWRISTYRHNEAAHARLERLGHYTSPAKAPTPWPDSPSGPKYTDAQVAELLDETRNDETVI